jgi:hypothetical protein
MGKAISMVASVFLSFLPHVGLLLKPLRLSRSALFFPVFSGVAGRWIFVLAAIRDAPLSLTANQAA